MKKLLFLTYILLLTSPIYSMKPVKTIFSEASKLSHAFRLTRMQTDDPQTSTHENIKNTDPRVKNYVLQKTIFKNYHQYRSKVERLVTIGADPNIIPDNGLIPLTVALDNNDTDFAVLLLNNYANPNLFVNPVSIDIHNHQETGSSPNIHHFASKPAFYFARDCKMAQLCIDYGAQANLKYHNSYKQIPDYGNVLTHVIDHKDYSPDLIPLYINTATDAAGPYSTSYASYDGSTLHHVVHTLNICLDTAVADRLLICAKHLLTLAPNLLHAKDQDGNTPGDCLNLSMKRKDRKEDMIKKFTQLFDQYAAAANIKNRLCE